MQKTPLTYEMKERASIKAEDDHPFKNTVLDRKYQGFLGEELFQSKYPEAKQDDTYDYDFLFHGKTIEVKTRLFKKEPQEHWDVTLFVWESRQQCDIYYFCGISEDHDTGYLLGWITKDDFFKKSTKVSKGDKCYNGEPAKTNSRNLKISELNPLRK